MKNQVDDSDLVLKDALMVFDESPEIREDDDEEARKKIYEDEEEIKPTAANCSFGKKTIRHFLQECNISNILDIREFAKQEGFNDSEQLGDLIDTLIRDKRREFTLGKGRKPCKLLIWKRRASQVPLGIVSLFQLVCTTKESILVEKYLEEGVDVNGSIDMMYNGEFSGRSPLHLALSHLASLSNSGQKLLTVYLLLHYGANIHAKDSQGNTPLHALFSGAPFNKQLFGILMENGADNSAVNNRGETAFELLVASSGNLDIEEYIEVGGCINRFNSVNHEGCISEIIRRVSAQRISSALSLMEVDSHGRTAIHNIVSFAFAKMKDAANNELYYEDMRTIIESILKQGGDIDCQDESGKTPLHYAAAFQNSQSVSLLLRLGADINVRDTSGKSALSSSLDLLTILPEKMMRNDSVIKAFMQHLCKLKTSGLLISQENEENFRIASIKYEKDNEDEPKFRGELEQSKDTSMGMSTLIPYDLMSETRIISSYPRSLLNDRYEIHHYLKNFYRKGFSDCSGLLIAHYDKTEARLMLARASTHSLDDHSIDHCLPDSGIDCIFNELRNKNLKNLFLATSARDFVNTETDIYVNP